MAQKHHNLLVAYDDENFLYRVTKISNKNVVEVDELFMDKGLAKTFFDSLVRNIELSQGFSAKVSESPSNKVQGNSAPFLARFGNLGVEVGLSIKPVVVEYRDLNSTSVHKSELGLYLLPENEIPEEVSRGGLWSRLFSLIK